MFYFAEVRNIVDDKTKSGRAKLRIYGIHDDTENIKDEHLPWGMPIMPSNSASTNKVGTAPTGLQVGSRVLCCFAANDTEQQYPIIIGSFFRGFPPVANAKEDDSNKDGFDSVDKSQAGVDLPSHANPDPDGSKSNLGKNPINPRITPDQTEVPSV